jgi:hypothetical protein
MKLINAQQNGTQSMSVEQKTRENKLQQLAKELE